MQIKVEMKGAELLMANIAGMGKQVRFATAVALTKTAKHAQKDVAQEFARVFDRPTPTVMKSLWVKPATKQNLAAMVYVKDRALGGKNPNSMAEVIAQQFRGGSRIAKQAEFVLRRDGFLAGDEFVAPGAAAKLDRYGNISRGQLVQVLSQIGVRSSGYDSTPTQSRRSRRNVQAAGVIFWSRGPEGRRTPKVDRATGISYGYTGGGASHLPKGAWMRTADGVKPILIAIRSPRYRARVNMEKIVTKTIERVWQQEFKAAFDAAKASAR